MCTRWIPLALATALLLPAQGTAQECEGRLVSEVRFSGCDTGRTASQKLQARLAELTDMPGALYSEAAAFTAVGRLQRTGYFRSVGTECAVAPDDTAVVTFRVVPNRYIREVRIAGTRVLYTEDLDKRIFLRSGSPFNPDEKESQERLDRQVSTLVTYVRQQGFSEVTVRSGTRLVEPDLVDVVLTVAEGKVSRIERISIDIDAPREAEDGPELSCPKVAKKALQQVLPVARGDAVTNSTVRDVKKSLREFLQQSGFISPRVSAKYDPATQRLAIHLYLRTCFAIHVVERDGMDPGSEKFEPVLEPEAMSVLPFRESGMFDRREAERGIEELLTWYHTRGFFFAEIEMQFVDYTTLVPGWANPLLGGVIYRVTRGQPAEIREIKFVGNQVLSQEELLSLMQTRKYDFFDVGGFLQVAQLFADLDLVKARYRELGHFRMRYLNAENAAAAVHVQHIRRKDYSLYRYLYQDKAFDVVKYDWESCIRLRIRIDEGEGSRVGLLRIAGVTQYAPEELSLALPLSPGGAFSYPLARLAADAIRTAYQPLGHTAQVRISCVGHDPDVPPAQCEVAKVESLRVDVTLTVDEGSRHVMGELFAVGNLKTADSVIFRDFPKPGEMYDTSRIDEATRRLRNLGVFSSVRVETIGLDESPPREEVAVVVFVEEGPTRFVEMSTGFQTMAREAEGGPVSMHPLASSLLSTSLHETGSPLTGSAGAQAFDLPDVLLVFSFAYSDNDFLGLAKQLYLPMSYGLSTVDPLRLASFTPTYVDRRFVGTDITLRVTPLIQYDRALRVFDSYEYGGETEFSYLVTQGIYLSLLSRVTRIAWKDPAQTSFGPLEFQLKLSPQIRFDWRDNPINPTSGTLVTGRVSYINALNDEGDRDTFFKYEVDAQLYLSFRRKVVLATNLRFGDSVSLSGNDLPENERFHLGGSNGVRGFPAGGILQYDATGEPRTTATTVTADDGSTHEVYSVVSGGNTMVLGSIELRFPVLRLASVWGAVFLDAGGLSEGLSRFNGNSLRYTTGIGVRWLIGDQIPVRLDYGFILDPRCAELDAETGQTCVAMDQRGALDFGLLYTF